MFYKAKVESIDLIEKELVLTQSIGRYYNIHDPRKYILKYVI